MPSKEPRRKYNEAFKKHTLELISSGQKGIEQAARELGITSTMIYRWRTKYQTLPPEPVAGEIRTVAQIEAENKLLRRELARVSEQRDILKKAMGIFSQDPSSDIEGLKK